MNSTKYWADYLQDVTEVSGKPVAVWKKAGRRSLTRGTAMALSDIFGSDDTDDWYHKPVVLGRVLIQFAGRSVPIIVVKRGVCRKEA